MCIKNKNGYFDINKECENFFCGFFNCLFDVNLVNLNINKYNYPSIDLGDDISGLCIQVTSETSFQKIKDTVNLFLKNRLDKIYCDLKIFIIGSKGKYKKKEITIDNYNFIISDSVLDCTDLGRLIYNEHDVNKVKKLYNIVNTEGLYMVHCPKNYLNNVQIQNVNLGNSYYSFIKSFGFKDNDSDFFGICNDMSRVINKFAYTLSELNLSTRQIIYGIILRRIKEIESNFLLGDRVKANSIFFIPVDVINYLRILSNDFYNELMILKSKKIYKTMDETGYDYDVISYIDEYGDDVMFQIVDYCCSKTLDIKEIIMNLNFSILD